MSNERVIPQTVMFPEVEQVAYRNKRCVIFFSTKSLEKELLIEFPFEIVFFTLPLGDEHILVVDKARPNTLILYNYREKCEVTSIAVASDILEFYSSRNYACAVFDVGAIVVSSNPLILLYTLKTPSVPAAISLVSTPDDPSHCIFSHEDDISEGNIVIHRIPSSAPTTTFRVAKSGIRCASISYNGKYIATTSIKGTIVRLYDINGKLIQESRRGFFNAKIVHVSFSPDSRFFSVTSSHQTAHIFKCEKSESDGYFLPKAEVLVPLEGSKTIRAHILEGGHSLCLTNEKGACLIYSIDVNTGESGLKSQIMLPTIAKMFCPSI
ncbi:hypothetical protein TVAG_483310 [Trichomonas vaginalis G3]|uniref:Uncharacterized protein n=1 Tax=Trichomonas vaginalis (strain ATCC PRA-98 / G3) TaxID=412133 RepID=A2ETA4_TRIV3|nr:phosphatidylinositol-3,5-bisphosphate binding [Trichomonas vaginalis G3]EAY04094.1 hypothetical protein TVAG_483310 [Trichomonas vaginalis G3]KAI5503844.1 phosphatidylinositol-3,5-bisphosphate binding [Trichomonas vaginalis G3]|eukprot:XP_001316317.1 hypothetical protein [Trichomonas vaginalis G3]